MAIACLRERTRGPVLLPECRVPALNSCMVFSMPGTDQQPFDIRPPLLIDLPLLADFPGFPAAPLPNGGACFLPNAMCGIS